MNNNKSNKNQKQKKVKERPGNLDDFVNADIYNMYKDLDTKNKSKTKSPNEKPNKLNEKYFGGLVKDGEYDIPRF